MVTLAVLPECVNTLKTNVNSQLAGLRKQVVELTLFQQQAWEQDSIIIDLDTAVNTMYRYRYHTNVKTTIY